MKTEVFIKMFRNDKKEKLIGFFKKNGFFLVLAVCVLGVGVGAFLGLGEADSLTEDEPPQQSSEQVQAIVTPKPASPTTTTPEPSANPTPSPETQTRSASTTRVTLAMPLTGEIIKAFSGDTLIYNATLNMWMTHNGIDIAATEGATVCAALAGVVSEVKNDDSKGIVVTISHGNNGSTVYACLKESSVKQGDKINAGQPVGSVGNSAFESAQGTHLHFEYLVKDVYVDPVDYLQK